MTKFLKIFNKYNKMFLGLLIIVFLGLIIYKGCSSKKVDLTSKSLIKELKIKQKVYEDSVAILNKKIIFTSNIKVVTQTKYITQRETIVKYKERLIQGADTQTLIILYDSTLATCDSLNKVNDTLISNYKYKTYVLDSINSTEAYKNYLAFKDISNLQKSLKQQKRKTTTKVMGSTIISVGLGFAAGFLTGFLK